LRIAGEAGRLLGMAALRRRHRTLLGTAGLAALLCAVVGSVLLQPPARAHPREGSVRAPVVVIGVAGLAWGDIRADQTPRLWRMLSGGAAAGAATVPPAPAIGCAADGWLSLSAGQFGYGLRLPLPGGPGTCAPMPAIRPTGRESARVTGWSELVDLQSVSEFSPRPGRLGQALAERAECATAVGPGAAVALADPEGDVVRYQATFDDASLDCPVTIIDGGQVVEPGTGRLNSLARIDRYVDHIMSRTRQDTTVLVQGVTKPPGGAPELAVSLLAGPATADRPGPAFLTAASTRWDGVVRLLDVPSTLLDAVGAAAPPEFSGAPIAIGGHRPDDATATVHRLGALTTTDRALRRWSPIVLWTALLTQLGLYALIALAARRGRRPGRRLRGGILVVAALPSAVYLVTLTRWWLAPLPDVALWSGIVVAAGGVAAAAALLPGRPLWRVPLAISLLTVMVLAVDAVTGTPLHRAGPFGPSAIYGGRYFGFGNSTFAVFAAAALVLAGAVAAELLARRRGRAYAVGAVAAIGGAAVAVDTWPSWGADVGGGLALVPGFAVLALAVAGVRLTLLRLVAACLAGVVTVAAVALADWSRPATRRTHAGQFVQDLIDGQAWEMVRRKAGYAAASLSGGPLAWLTVALLAYVVLVLVRPDRFGPAALAGAARQWPTLRPTVAAIVVTSVLGALVNDYGIRLVTFAFITMLPLVAYGCVRGRGHQPVPRR
jgi:hypothetical protein